MNLDDVAAFAGSLDGCRRRRAAGRVGWYVDGLLVVRPDEPGTILIRVDRAQRDALLTANPDTFGVPPHWETHEKVQASLDGDADAIRSAIRLSWDRQRRARARP
ncbi:MmcQ/YjbR family DNA-binding protein [Microbacterium gorillae]|uniref:MmcQ/YjbR family DNA-binding protein n=1 Tax=Microbacterium gorillae TaxID=1231063 RepID=UPI00058F7847|nr:MmcQ/YjbR family DNA-binding protein [Microbacterium gorillae]